MLVGESHLSFCHPSFCRLARKNGLKIRSTDQPKMDVALADGEQVGRVELRIGAALGR